MPVYKSSGAGSVIQPTRMLTADGLIIQTVSGTAYTLVSVTNGRGKVTRISLSNSTSVPPSSTIRIIIDGITCDYPLHMIANSGMNARSLGYDSGRFSYDCIMDINFYSSLVIQVFDTGGNNINYAIAD